MLVLALVLKLHLTLTVTAMAGSCALHRMEMTVAAAMRGANAALRREVDRVEFRLSVWETDEMGQCCGLCQHPGQEGVVAGVRGRLYYGHR